MARIASRWGTHLPMMTYCSHIGIFVFSTISFSGSVTAQISGHSVVSTQASQVISASDGKESRVNFVSNNSPWRTSYSESKVPGSVSKFRSIKDNGAPTDEEIKEYVTKAFPHLNANEQVEAVQVLRAYNAANRQLYEAMINKITPDQEVLMHGIERDKLLVKQQTFEIKLAGGIGVPEALRDARTFLEQRRIQ